MHRPGAAECVHRHTARIFAALAEMSTRGVGHVLVDDLMNAPGDLLCAHVNARADAGERAARAVEIQTHLAAEKILWIEITKHQIGIGHGWLRTALAITNRSRIG